MQRSKTGSSTALPNDSKNNKPRNLKTQQKNGMDGDNLAQNFPPLTKASITAVRSTVDSTTSVDCSDESVGGSASIPVGDSPAETPSDEGHPSSDSGRSSLSGSQVTPCDELAENGHPIVSKIENDKTGDSSTEPDSSTIVDFDTYSDVTLIPKPSISYEYAIKASKRVAKRTGKAKQGKKQTDNGVKLQSDSTRSECVKPKQVSIKSTSNDKFNSLSINGSTSPHESNSLQSTELSNNHNDLEEPSMVIRNGCRADEYSNGEYQSIELSTPNTGKESSSVPNNQPELDDKTQQSSYNESEPSESTNKHPVTESTSSNETDSSGTVSQTVEEASCLLPDSKHQRHKIIVSPPMSTDFGPMFDSVTSSQQDKQDSSTSSLDIVHHTTNYLPTSCCWLLPSSDLSPNGNDLQLRQIRLLSAPDRHRLTDGSFIDSNAMLTSPVVDYRNGLPYLINMSLMTNPMALLQTQPTRPNNAKLDEFVYFYNTNGNLLAISNSSASSQSRKSPLLHSITDKPAKLRSITPTPSSSSHLSPTGSDRVGSPIRPRAKYSNSASRSSNHRSPELGPVNRLVSPKRLYGQQRRSHDPSWYPTSLNTSANGTTTTSSAHANASSSGLLGSAKSVNGIQFQSSTPFLTGTGLRLSSRGYVRSTVSDDLNRSVGSNSVRQRKVKHSSKTNLYIRGLQIDFTEEQLHQLAPDRNLIRSVKLIAGSEGEMYGFIDFTSNLAAKNALQCIKNNNRELYVNFAYESEKDPQNVYITNIPETWTAANVEDLKKVFEPYGQIATSIVMTRRSNNFCTGAGFVRFVRSDDAQRAIEGIRNTKVVLDPKKGPLEVKLADKQKVEEECFSHSKLRLLKVENDASTSCEGQECIRDRPSSDSSNSNVKKTIHDNHTSGSHVNGINHLLSNGHNSSSLLGPRYDQLVVSTPSNSLIGSTRSRPYDALTPIDLNNRSAAMAAAAAASQTAALASAFQAALNATNQMPLLNSAAYLMPNPAQPHGTTLAPIGFSLGTGLGPHDPLCAPNTAYLLCQPDPNGGPSGHQTHQPGQLPALTPTGLVPHYQRPTHLAPQFIPGLVSPGLIPLVRSIDEMQAYANVCMTASQLGDQSQHQTMSQLTESWPNAALIGAGMFNSMHQ